MPSNYSTIGLRFDDEAEMVAFANRAVEEGTAVETRRGHYYRLTDTSGAELWAQADRGGRRLIGLAPHFAGKTRFALRITDRIVRAEDSALDGAFHAWEAEDDMFPLVFDVPDGGVHDRLELPSVVQVQIAAFAHECACFRDDEAFDASQTEEPGFAAESFVPAGLFNEDDEEPAAMALMSGHVAETRELTNGWSGETFQWAHVRTLGGELDVVADPEVLEGDLVAGGVVHGMFWLSGLLERGAAPPNPPRRRLWQRRSPQT